MIPAAYRKWSHTSCMLSGSHAVSCQPVGIQTQWFLLLTNYHCRSQLLTGSSRHTLKYSTPSVLLFCGEQENVQSEVIQVIEKTNRGQQEEKHMNHSGSSIGTSLTWALQRKGPEDDAVASDFSDQITFNPHKTLQLQNFLGCFTYLHNK